MTAVRRPVVEASTARRVRRDPRFQAALGARTGDQGWRSKGRCLHVDPEIFFPTAAEDPSPALRVCATCPVAAPCLAAALDAGDCDGVWGASTPAERRVMRPVWAAVLSG